jgi:hypothetical protein
VPLPDLDAWLPEPDIRTHHRRVVAAAPDALWDAARSVRLDETQVLGRLVRWRIPGTPGRLSYSELFAVHPFHVLEEGPLHSLSGLVGRIWTLRRDYPELSGPDEFRGWDVSGTVRVLMAHGVRELHDGRSELVSEARVGAVDLRASLRLRGVWSVLGHFESLIAQEPLSVAARRVARSPAPAPRAG